MRRQGLSFYEAQRETLQKDSIPQERQGSISCKYSKE